MFSSIMQNDASSASSPGSGGLFSFAAAGSGGGGLFGAGTGSLFSTPASSGGLFSQTSSSTGGMFGGAAGDGQADQAQDDEYVVEEEVTSVPGWTPSVTLEVKEHVDMGEDDLEELYSQRSKLFRFRDAEWKERGLGEAKLLKHKVTGQVRFMLRQEKTLKIVANHLVVDVAPYCDLRPNSGSDKCWVWTAQDFSEDEPVIEQFALKFGKPELATAFKEEFDKAKDMNRNVVDIPEASSDSVPASKDNREAVEEYKKESVEDCKQDAPSSGGGLFSTPSSGSSLFGSGPASGGLFSTPAATSGGGLFSSAASSGSGLFGGGLFSNTASSGSGLFSSTASGTAGGLFGQDSSSGYAAPATAAYAAPAAPVVRPAADYHLPANPVGVHPAADYHLPANPVAGAQTGQADATNEGNELVPEEEVTIVDGWTPSVTLEVKEKVELGEEDEEELYSQRSKLYRYNDEEWKERGLGEAKLLKHKETGKVRLMLRQEKTLKIVANHFVIDYAPYCDLRPNAGSDKCWTWIAQDYADEELHIETLALKFGTPELASKFKEAFDNAKQMNRQAIDLSTSPSMSPKDTPSPAPAASAGLFAAASAPSGATSSSGLFGASSGGSLFSGASSSSGLFGASSGGSLFSGASSSSTFAPVSASPASAQADSGNAGEDEYVVEEEVVTVPGWAPSITLEVGNVDLGEGDEEELYSQRSKLYRFRDGEWKERGLGDAKLLKHKQNGKVRFMLRQEKTLKIVANHFVVDVPPYCDLRSNAGSDKCLVWTAQDCAEDEPVIEQFAIKFKDADLANAFWVEFDKAKAINLEAIDVSASGGDAQKAAPSKVALSEKAPAKEKVEEAKTVATAGTGSSLFSGDSAPSSSLFGGTSSASSSLFTMGSTSSSPWAGAATGGLFSTPASTSGGLFGGGTGLFAGSTPAPGGLFSGAASSSGGAFTSAPASSGSLFPSPPVGSQPPANAQVDQAKPANADEDEYVVEEEVTSVPGWTPSVTLSVIDVDLGEGDEEELYSQRSKLFRFRDGEWKERGTGEAKLLKHKSSGKVRFMVRQEKTLKIVGNHFVVDVAPYCDLRPNSGSDKCWVWTAQDCADEEPATEQFALKFGSPELAAKFKEAFDQAKEINRTLFDLSASGASMNTAGPSKEAAAAGEDGKKYLEENKKKDGVIALASGLQYKVLTKGFSFGAGAGSTFGFVSEQNLGRSAPEDSLPEPARPNDLLEISGHMRFGALESPDDAFKRGLIAVKQLVTFGVNASSAPAAAEDPMITSILGSAPNSDTQTVHYGFTCDATGQNPIIGVRYKSTSASNHDISLAARRTGSFAGAAGYRPIRNRSEAMRFALGAALDWWWLLWPERRDLFSETVPNLQALPEAALMQAISKLPIAA